MSTVSQELFYKIFTTTQRGRGLLVPFLDAVNRGALQASYGPRPSPGFGSGVTTGTGDAADNGPATPEPWGPPGVLVSVGRLPDG